MLYSHYGTESSVMLTYSAFLCILGALLVPVLCASLLSVRSGNGRLASLGSLVGFVVMMSLDVGLG